MPALPRHLHVDAVPRRFSSSVAIARSALESIRYRFVYRLQHGSSIEESFCLAMAPRNAVLSGPDV